MGVLTLDREDVIARIFCMTLKTESKLVLQLLILVVISEAIAAVNLIPGSNYPLLGIINLVKFSITIQKNKHR